MLFEIRPTREHSGSRGGVFPKGRILIGRSESCDLLANHDSVSAIHAVLEIFDDHAVVYDMNSTNGTYLNDDKVITKDVRIGDRLRFADIEFTFEKYEPAKASLPPVLETLEPAAGAASVRVPPVAPPVAPEMKNLPKTAPVVTDMIPSIVYPLAADPKAEFSEYIFEDQAQIYPIFRYEAAKQAVEVIILFKDQIYSVDYLPEGKSTYYISGWWTSEQELEFPFFGKAEKIPFVDVRGKTSTVHTLPGFGVFFLSDRKKDTGHVASTIDLQGQDIVRLQKNDIQIFVRNVAAPPTIAAAPILKRDPEFQKYLIFFMLLVSAITVSFNLVEVPEDEKKDELAPERLATILYKQPLTVTKNKSVAKTEDTPKVAQKAPEKTAVAKDIPKDQPQPEIDKPDVITTKDQTQKSDPGEKNAATKKIVKQGTERITQTTTKIATNLAASKSNNKIQTKSAASAFSTSGLQTKGPVEVYKSADFASSINTMVAKGGTLSGIRTRGATGAGGGTDLVGANTGVSTGSGSIKTAEIATNQGSLVGATTGVLDRSKGSGGLSAKKAIFTAGIPSETVVLGSMDPDVIRRILLDHLPQFRYCYQKELERTGSETSGTVKLDFIIGASGHVTEAGVDGSSGLPTDVKKCVVGVLKGIEFPEPMGGGKVEVKQPMNFYPKKL